MDYFIHRSNTAKAIHNFNTNKTKECDSLKEKVGKGFQSL